jgi:hypothetical protein
MTIAERIDPEGACQTHGHGFGEWEYVANNSCEQVRVCTRCNHQETGEREVHSFGEWETKGTDTQVRICQRCAREEQRPLIEGLRDGTLQSRLACYRILEQKPGSVVPMADVQSLVESLATEIRRLYSRTGRGAVVVGYEWVYDEYDYGSPSGLVRAEKYESREEPDPDIAGIKDLVASIPNSLRDQVRELSGEADHLV